MAGAATLLLTEATTSLRLRSNMRVFGKSWHKVEPELYAMPLALPRYSLLLALFIAATVLIASVGLHPLLIWPAFLAVMSYLGLFLVQTVSAMRRHRR